MRGVRDPRYAITGWRETRTDLKYNLLVINKICIYKGEKVSRHARMPRGEGQGTTEQPFLSLRRGRGGGGGGGALSLIRN